MNITCHLRAWMRLALSAMAIIMAAGSPFIAGSAETKLETAPATTNSVPPASTATPRKSLTGAELYSMHCNRCHPERYPTERTAANWKTITLHMQVRANLPPEQARIILKYLQENSGR